VRKDFNECLVGMAVTDVEVVFHATSATHSAAELTSSLEIDPTTSWERGDTLPRRSGYRRTSDWMLEIESDDPMEPLNAALAELLAKLAPADAAVMEARAHYEICIRCSGTATSPQGGFYLSPEVVIGLGALGVEFLCTIYFDYEAEADRMPDPAEAEADDVG
jgi:hypothetical protein